METEAEEVEGLGDEIVDVWGDYPIDTVLIRTETRTVYDVVRRIEKGSFVMNPDFQRDFIWPDDKQSKLIESVLMRIPLPVFYLAEDGQGRTIVVDGLQRLSTFQRFCKNELRLPISRTWINGTSGISRRNSRIASRTAIWSSMSSMRRFRSGRVSTSSSG
ncbi:MAG: DUF262 domain-containing protein [Planctomycetota bacterium]|nr:DUF262 domain-containing protein [Planctomycetota bacterium]